MNTNTIKPAPKRTTKAQVLKALRQLPQFKDIDLWYDRSASSWVFGGKITENWTTKYACVYRLNDLTPSQWVEVAESLSETYNTDNTDNTDSTEEPTR